MSDADLDLAKAFGEVARELDAQQGVDGTLQRAVRAAVATIPGAEHAAVSLVQRRGRIETVATSSPVPEKIDAAQYESVQGPCLDAAWTDPVVRVDDLTTERRWPEFTPRAVGLGIRSMLSFQLFVRDGTLGALNLYASPPNAFDAESEHVGWVFAAHAAVALAGRRREEQLTEALRSRDVIGQAKGILMERHKVTGDRAFQMLVWTSQHNNVRLVEVAEYLVRTGEEQAVAGGADAQSTGTS